MWQPDPKELEQLTQIFAATLSPKLDQRNAANETLAAARSLPQFENYLCHLLVLADSTSAAARAAAGVALKNLVLKHRSAPLLDVKARIVAGLLLLDTTVRNITGNVITAIFSAHGVDGWPQVLPKLLLLVDGDDVAPLCREAAASALAKICEDSGASLDHDYEGQRPLDHMVPRVISAATSNVSGAARGALLRSINHLIPLKLQLVLVHLERYLDTLFQFTLDENASVRRAVCSAFLLVLETRPDRLVPHVQGVVDHCIRLVEDADEAVAMEACEFLLALAERPDKAIQPVFRACLDRVLPVLLRKMVFSDEQLVLMEILDRNDNAAVADRAQDILPASAKGSDVHMVGRKSGARGVDAGAGSDSDADSDSATDSDDEDALEQWNLRRCAAATLDALALQYPAQVVRGTLPALQENIVSGEWPVREAAILAFGAIARSCMDLASDKLPALVPFLVERMDDAETRVRQMASWTLSRYARWVAQEAADGGPYAPYFQPTFEAVARRALDRKKAVQEAACSALTHFIEASDASLLRPTVGPMAEHFAQCFALYQRKNLAILYDCVGTFVEKIGAGEFNLHPQHAQTLLSPLLADWLALDDTDTDLWPLLECMSTVAAAMGQAFAPYAVPVYERALSILGKAVQLHRDQHTDPLIETPEKDFMVTSLDLIDGLVVGFQGHFAELMHQHGTSAMVLVLACLDDPDDDVRQLAFALVGDLAIHVCAHTVQPHLADIVRCASAEIARSLPGTFAATNNAIWALGEAALQCLCELYAPHVPHLVDLLIRVLIAPDTQQAVLDNAAICLGRLGHVAPSDVVCRLPEFVSSWCTHMMCVEENDEKESAFLGMVHTLNAAPDEGFGGLQTPAGRKNLALFVSCLGHYFEPLHKLRDVFFLVLVGYKDVMGASWAAVMKHVDADTRGFLSSTYGV